MLKLRRAAPALVVLFTLWPTLVFGQAPRAGVVTTLEGNVTVTRAALPQPQPLKFKDDVFQNDKITTGDKAIARMLLGGKALVTVRERSSLTITEIPGKSTIDLDAGKIALAVAKDKMKPGESIEIRTQNAVAGVRGTVVVAEVSRPTAQGTQPGLAPAAALVTTFYVLRGQIEAIQLNALTGQPVGPPVPIGTLQQFRAAGFTPGQVTPIPPGAVAQIVHDVTTKPQPVSGGGDSAAKDNAMSQTVALTTAITGGGGVLGGGDVIQPPTPYTQPPPPILPGNQQIVGGGEGGGLLGLPANLFVNSAFAPFIPSSGGSSDPIVNIGSGATVGSVTGSGFIVPEELPVTLDRPLLSANAGFSVTGDLVTILDTLNSRTTASLLAFDPTSISVGGHFINVGSGGHLIATGPLLTDLGGNSLSTDGSFLNVQGGGTVHVTTGSPIFGFTGSNVSTDLDFIKVDGEASIVSAPGVGPLVKLTNVAGTSGHNFSIGSGSLVHLHNAAQLTVSGPILDMTDSGTPQIVENPALPITLSGAVLRQSGDPTVFTSTSTTLPAFRMSGGLFTADALVSGDGNPHVISVAGPVIELTNGARLTLRTMGDDTDFSVVSLQRPLNSPFLIMDQSRLTLTGTDPNIALATLNDDTAGHTTAGVGIIATGDSDHRSIINLKGNVLKLVGFSTTATDALAQLTWTNVTQTGNLGRPLFRIDAAGADRTMVGPLLAATDSNLTGSPEDPPFVLIHNSLGEIFTTLTANSTVAPFIRLTNSTVTMDGPLVRLGDEQIDGNRLTFVLKNSLLVANATDINTNQQSSWPLLEVNRYNTLTLNAAASVPLIDLTGGSVDTGSAAVLATHYGHLTVPGALLRANGTTLTAGGLLNIDHYEVQAGAASTPAIDFTNVTASLSGPVLFANGDFRSVGAPMRLTDSSLTANSMIVTGGCECTVNLGGSVELINSTVSLVKLLFLDEEDHINTSSPVFDMRNNSRLILDRGDGSNEPWTIGVPLAVVSGANTTPDPIITLAGQFITLEPGAASFVDLVRIVDGGVTFNGPLLDVGFSEVDIHKGGALVLVSGTAIDNSATQPFIRLDNSTIGTNGDLVKVTGTLTLNHSLLRDSTGSFLRAKEDNYNQLFDSVGTPGSPVAVALTPDGARAYVTSDANSVRIVRVRDAFVIADLALDTTPGAVAANASGTRVYVAGADGTVTVVDNTLATPAVVNTFSSGGTAPAAIAVSPDGSKLFVANSGSNNVKVLNATTGAVLNTLLAGIAAPSAVALSPDGSLVYVAKNVPSGRVLVFNASTGASVTTVEVGNNPLALAVSPNGNKLYVANSSSNTVSVIDTATNVVVATVGVGVSPRSLAVTPDNTRVYVVNGSSDSVSVINTVSNTVIATMTAVGAVPSSIAISGDGLTAVITSDDPSVAGIFNVDPGGSILNVPAGGTFTSLATTAPVLELSSTDIHTGRSLVSVAGTLNLRSPLLVATDMALDVGGGLLSVLKGGTLTDTAPTTSANALIQLTNGEVTSGGLGSLVTVGGGLASGTATLTLKRPLLSATGVSIEAIFSLLHVMDGGVVTNTATDPLMAFTRTKVWQGSGLDAPPLGNVVQVDAGGRLSLNGPLVTATFDEVTVPWAIDRFVLAQCGSGSPCTTGAGGLGLSTGSSTSPLIEFSGAAAGSHSVALEMFKLVGTATTSETDADALGNTVGTDQPLRHGGVLFRGTGTSLTADKVITVDSALFAATLPILNLTAGSVLTTNNHVMEVVNAGKVTANLSGDALFKLNASALTINNGSLVSLSGSSFVKINGNLLSLANGSIVNILNGALVNVAGNSVFSLSGGSLAVFAGIGNSLTITNSFPGSVVNVSGIPVALLGGAQANQVSVGGGFTPFVGGSPTLTNGANNAVLVVNGTSAKVKLGL